MTVAVQTDEGWREPEFTLGDRLRKSRESADPSITQDEMGELLKDVRPGARHGKPYSHGTIAAWEADVNKPPLPVIRKWAEITHVQPTWLLETEGFTVRAYASLEALDGAEWMQLPLESPGYKPFLARGHLSSVD